MTPSVNYGYFPYAAEVYVLPGEQVTLTATAECADGDPEYRLIAFGEGFNGVTELASWGDSNVFIWDSTGAPFGYHYFHTYVRRKGLDVEWEGIGKAAVAVRPCLTMNLLPPTPSPPAPSGTPVTYEFTTDCVVQEVQSMPVLEFRWWTYTTDSGWEVAQDWSPSQQFVWDTNGLGAGDHFRPIVNIRGNGGGGIQFVTGDSWHHRYELTDCQLSSLTERTVSPAPPAPPGSLVSIEVEADCLDATEYKFWVYDIAADTWSLGRNWGASATFTWDTGDLPAGAYLVQAWARNPAGIVVARNIRYTLDDSCDDATIESATPASPSVAGVSVSFSASASCSGGSPEYKWWLRGPSGIWTLLRQWAPASTSSWNTTGLPSGSYRVQVWIRAQGSKAFYDGYDTLTHEILPGAP